MLERDSLCSGIHGLRQFDRANSLWERDSANLAQGFFARRFFMDSRIWNGLSEWGSMRTSCQGYVRSVMFLVFACPEPVHDHGSSLGFAVRNLSESRFGVMNRIITLCG